MSVPGQRRVLVVDDSPLDLAALREILRPFYSVQCVTDASSALQALGAGEKPDLVLLDVIMPGTDGLEVCRRIRADPATADIPVIFVTARETEEDEAAGFAAGAVDYVVKPVSPHLLLARVKTHVELKAAREGLEMQNRILRENVSLRDEVEQISRHDLKNPLMIILNIPDVLLKRPGIGTEEAGWLRMIQDAARRMLDMINVSIDRLKMEKGEYRLRAGPVDALGVARQIVAAHAGMAANHAPPFRLIVEGRPATEADTFAVCAEEPLLHTLFSNLVRNAVEASPPGGGVTLTFSRGAMGVISIHNQGAIPPSVRGRFFQKFATAEKPGGTGLGAYSAKLITRTLGGTIEYQTSEEGGTTITVSLPLDLHPAEEGA